MTDTSEAPPSQEPRTVEARLDELEWLLTRINSKLDNLGQLRHLYKMQRRVHEMTNAMNDIALYFRTKGKKELDIVFPERLMGRDE